MWYDFIVNHPVLASPLAATQSPCLTLVTTTNTLAPPWLDLIGKRQSVATNLVQL